jgi:hypothetical protein
MARGGSSTKRPRTAVLPYQYSRERGRPFPDSAHPRGAQKLRVSTATVYYLCDSGRIVYVRVNNTIRVSALALRRFLRTRKPRGQGRNTCDSESRGDDCFLRSQVARDQLFEVGFDRRPGAGDRRRFPWL